MKRSLGVGEVVLGQSHYHPQEAVWLSLAGESPNSLHLIGPSTSSDYSGDAVEAVYGLLYPIHRTILIPSRDARGRCIHRLTDC